MTALFHAIVGVGEGIVQSTGGVSAVSAIALGFIAAGLPGFITAVSFTVVYRGLPDVRVELKDAAFGAMVAVVLFKLGKHLFFWFTSLVAHRHAIYGPLGSIAILQMWIFVGGLIFLYGAALTKTARELRPRTFSEVTGILDEE